MARAKKTTTKTATPKTQKIYIAICSEHLYGDTAASKSNWVSGSPGDSVSDAIDNLEDANGLEAGLHVIEIEVPYTVKSEDRPHTLLVAV